MKYQNLAEMFFKKREEMPDKTAYMFKENDQWLSVSFKDAVDKAEKYAAAFMELGIKKDDKIAVISNNCMDWALVDYAAMSLGAILVPVYPSLLAEQAAYIINDGESRIVVAENEVQTEKIDSVKSQLKTVGHFLSVKPGIEGWKSLSEHEKSGAAYLSANPQAVSDSMKNVHPEDTATFIYTSGTTGEPKGVMLSHNNLLSNVDAASKVVIVERDYIFLSFLPLSHSFERMAGHYLATLFGATIAYAESIETVAQNMTEIRPHVLLSVPRLYEKIYSRVLESVEGGPALKRKIFYWALNTGKKYVYKKMNNEAIPGGLQFKYNLAVKLVFKKLWERVGGRIVFLVSGGAPLSPVIAEFFGSVGLLILEGYGLTETSPVISVNSPDKFKFGSVGQTIENVEVKIAEDGELLARGPNIMQGYYKKEAETKEMIDDEGWLHTGDIAFIDENNMIHITDRKKNLIVTSGGKNIAPAPVENALITSPYIEQAVMIGDRQKFCSAVLVCDRDALINYATAEQVPFKEYADLVKHEKIRSLLAAEIESRTKNFANYEKIKDFVIVEDPFTIETGELTPSLKIKRRVISEKYANEIEAMYKA